MTLIVVTPPAVEPVSVAEAKAWCRIDASDDDSIVTLLIQAMREYAENVTGRAFVQRTLQLNLECLPTCIELPMPPLVSVASVKYTDEDQVLRTLAADQYTVDDQKEPGRIVPAWGANAWPSAIPVPNSVRIQYVAGYPAYGSPADDYTTNVPAALKLWMRARMATLYENREQLVANNLVQIPHGFGDGFLDALVIGSRLF
jgi:uncharacterized phiE125 gp8 family phage protein